MPIPVISQTETQHAAASRSVAVGAAAAAGAVVLTAVMAGAEIVRAPGC